MSARNEKTIEDFIGGNVALIDTVTEWGEEEFADISRDRRFVVTPASVITVLRAFRDHTVTSSQAQAWGDFAMHGFKPGAVAVPAEALEVHYADEYEDSIAIAVMRLSELGDVVDGEFRPGEIDQLIAALER